MSWVKKSKDNFSGAQKESSKLAQCKDTVHSAVKSDSTSTYSTCLVSIYGRYHTYPAAFDVDIETEQKQGER